MVPCFPLLGLTPSGLFMGLSSTISYTSELIHCSTISVPIFSYSLSRSSGAKVGRKVEEDIETNKLRSFLKSLDFCFTFFLSF